MIRDRTNTNEAPAVHTRPDDLVKIRVPLGDGRFSEQMIRRDVLMRRAMAVKVARQTVHLAENVHVTEAGRRITLDAQWRDVYADPSPDKRIIAGAQRGKTTYELCVTMAQLSLGMSVGWVMPKKEKVTELVNGKLNGTITNTPFYQQLQEEAGGTDAIAFKRFGPHAKLYIVTANSENELTSFSADAMHVDERDFCNRTNLPMYTSRMLYSAYKFTDEISTPTFEGSEHNIGAPGNDHIHSEWLGGDQGRYMVPCNRCGYLQIVDWYENFIKTVTDDSGRVIDFQVLDQDWSPGDPQDLRACCQKCGFPMDRLAPGKWVFMRPGRRIRSRWIEALCTTTGYDMATLLGNFQKALANPTKLQHFHNMELGRPFAGGMVRMTREMFEKTTRAGHHLQQSSEAPTTIGIDVNRPWLDVQISRWIEGEQIKVFAGRFSGGKEEMIGLMRRFNVRGGVIDHQPETKFAMALQDAAWEELRIPLVRCKYATSDQNKLMIVSEAGENPKLDAPRLITVNRTIAIDTIYEWFQTGLIGWFEEWETAMDGRLFNEMTKPVRKTVLNEAGIERPVWEGVPDHQLHAAVYDMLAGLVLELNVSRDYSQVHPVVSIISGAGAPKPPALPSVQHSDLMLYFRG